MPKVLALAAENTKAVFHKRYVDIREVGNSDVSIKVQYCGVCHSDLHQVRGEWPIPTLYPMVPGHEIVGVVDAVGPNVTKYKVGDRVGVGCMVDSCRDCEECKQGIEQYCDNGNTPTYNGKWADGSLTFGGYSERMVVDEHFVLRIPDNMDLAKAGPLLCAGITTYSPLVHFGALKAGSDFHVGVQGFGGLGHMAVKLAKAMGNQVTVISRGEKKRANAEELGANFVNSEDPAQVKSVRKAFNLIISTVAGKFNGWNSVMGMLKTNGVLALVGLPPTAIELEPFSVVGGRKSFAGSGIGGIKETQEMLDFCAAHEVYPEVSIVDVKEINKIHASLFEGQGDVFRFVLDIAETLKDGEWDVEVDKRTAEQTWTVRGNVEPADRNVHAAAAREE